MAVALITAVTFKKQKTRFLERYLKPQVGYDNSKHIMQQPIHKLSITLCLLHYTTLLRQY